MLGSALLDLSDEPQVLLQKLNEIGVPRVRYEIKRTVKCGVSGLNLHVLVDGEPEEAHDHDHEHDHEHEHTHDHNSLHGIEHIVSKLNLPETVKADVLAVYRRLAEAESRVHGVEVREIHFHEVGSLDAIADIAAVCLLLHELKVSRVLCSAVAVGSGSVRCAHGILPVPAPATAELLRGVPIYSGSVKGELCTPTGAALLRHFASDFGELPEMKLARIGCGMGKKDFPAANCVRALLGESGDSAERIAELSCNLDDMTPEALAFAAEELLRCGALDVFTTPIIMKKSRAGALLTVLCPEAERERFAELLFRHTSTLGVRCAIRSRYTLSRKLEAVDTPLGTLRRKSSEGFGVKKEKYEYDDLAALARQEGLSLDEVRRMLE